MKKFIYVFGGIFLCLVVLFFIFSKSDNNKEKISFDLGGLKVSRVDKSEFGEINLQNQSSMNTEAKGLGGGGGVLSTPELRSVIAPDFTKYNYVYKGEDFLLEKEEALVYKYQNLEKSSKDIVDFLKKVNFGLVDINKFNNLNLQTLSFNEGRDFGYSINIDLKMGMINIYENWAKWQNNDPRLNCGEDEECFKRNKLTINDVPTDNELIKMADDFLNQYGINKDNYGEAIINNEWKNYYLAENEEENIPETMQVIYPLVIEGQKVYEQSGYPVGLNVNVNIFYKKVSGVYGLRIENYQSAMYNLETNKEEILKKAEEGGLYSYFENNNNKTYDIELDSPEFGFVKVYNFKDNAQEEILVPGLIFSTKNKPDNYYGRQKVVVLLVKDILSENNNIEPMMIK